MTLSEEFFGNLIAFGLTLLVFSYLIRDNPVYRAVVHAFIGVTAAYVTIVAFQSVLAPRFMDLVQDALENDWLFGVGFKIWPWFLGFFIFLKLFSRSAGPGNFFGNAAVAFIVGVGAALAVGGAIVGTIFGQLQAAWSAPTGANVVEVSLGWLQWLAAFVATTAVLLYFFYTGQALPNGQGTRLRFMVPVAWVGQGFLTVALAALYVGALTTTLALFVERINFLYRFLTGPDIAEILRFFGINL